MRVLHKEMVSMWVGLFDRTSPSETDKGPNTKWCPNGRDLNQ